MLHLLSPTPEVFSTGAARYEFNPLAGSDTSARIMLQVQINGWPARVVVDTGTSYLICSPGLAEALDLNISASLQPHTHFIRGYRVTGHLYRTELTLLAEEGESLSFEVTAFAPTPEQAALGLTYPTFIGMTNCLERTRFALDPFTQTFYFGPPP